MTHACTVIQDKRLMATMYPLMCGPSTSPEGAVGHAVSIPLAREETEPAIGWGEGLALELEKCCGLRSRCVSGRRRRDWRKALCSGGQAAHAEPAEAHQCLIRPFGASTMALRRRYAVAIRTSA
jgi:hypothetical protein